MLPVPAEFREHIAKGQRMRNEYVAQLEMQAKHETHHRSADCQCFSCCLERFRDANSDCVLHRDEHGDIRCVSEYQSVVEEEPKPELCALVKEG